jgi:nitrogen fixation/metabolism regulation signal transduction histidine kinase
VAGPWRRSLARELAAIAAGGVVTTAVVAGAAAVHVAPWTAIGLGAAVGLIVALWAVHRLRSSLRRTLEALGDGVRGLRDGDFSLRLTVRRRDELGDLLALYNQVADALRSERADIYQRELLLDTVLQGAPMAILLAGPTLRIVYANRAARDLLGGGRRLEGQSLESVLASGPAEMREAATAAGESLFTVTGGGHGEDEIYRAVRRSFHLNTQPHTLCVIERLTPELRRQEVEVWKKVIRVMSHELHNSLAVIRSLAHSARTAAASPGHAARLDGIFAALGERATHLVEFLEGYARFARLPRPQKRDVPWQEFLDGVGRLSPFRLDGAPPREPGWFDPSQMEQVLINLLKNAHEAGSPPEEVAVSVATTVDGRAVLRVLDRGRGMDDEEMRRALLPFYSSKPSGTGLGLPLCREIVEAHGGQLRIESRPGGGLIVTCLLRGRRPTAAL